MFTPPLLPHRFKLIGWLLLVPAFLAWMVLAYFDYDAQWIQADVFAFWNETLFEKDKSFVMIRTDITATLVGVVFIIGGMLVAFSREHREDEFIANLRLSSWMWAVMVSYLLLLLAFIFIYGMAFLNVMIINMFMVLVIFIIRFNYLLYRNSKSLTHEK